MSYIINLSSAHSYSTKRTISAFVDLCDEHSHCYYGGPLAYLQRTINYIWVVAAYQRNYKRLIEPYKLGKISTTDFLKELSKIFYFLHPLDEKTRHRKLAEAWNSSIKPSNKTKKRFDFILEKAKQAPVFLISNSNELNVEAILKMLEDLYPDLDLSKVDVSIKKDPTPIELFPNVYLCLSYRCGVFKTAGLIQLLEDQVEKPITLVSQYEQDLEKGKELRLAAIMHADTFYVRQRLEDYVEQREQGDEYYFSRNCLSFFNMDNRSYSATVKISAAKKVLANWDDLPALRSSLTDFEIHALHEGRLGKIFKQFPGHRTLSQDLRKTLSSSAMDQSISRHI